MSYLIEDGYQQLTRTKWSGEVAGAHRKIYSLFVGPLNKYDIISHSCGDCLCLNPYHLFRSGEQECKETFDFKYDLRRTVSPEARSEMAISPLNNRDFAKKYGIHEMTVRSLRADMRRTYMRRGHDTVAPEIIGAPRHCGNFETRDGMPPGFPG